MYLISRSRNRWKMHSLYKFHSMVFIDSFGSTKLRDDSVMHVFYLDIINIVSGTRAFWLEKFRELIFAKPSLHGTQEHLHEAEKVSIENYIITEFWTVNEFYDIFAFLCHVFLCFLALK